MAIEGKKRVELNQESIFKRITEYDIYKFYMPHQNWKINEVCLSPFRHEKNPSFRIGNSGSSLCFIDFGETKFRGDALTFVKMMFDLKNLDEVLKKIDTDFKLGISSGTFSTDYKMIVSSYKQPEEAGKRYSMIQVVTRKFTKEELSYWNEFHQDITDLQKEHIFSIDKVFFNRRRYTLGNELRFGYYYNGNWKIYRPNTLIKKLKWSPNNVPITTMDGKENLVKDKLAFICGSKKDYMVVKKVYEHTCATQNEGEACFSADNLSFLRTNSSRQVLGYDSDIPGVSNSQQITQMFNFDYCNPPKKYLAENINDWASLGKTHGLKAIEDYFKEKKLIK
jgi:hypothetical protein